MPGPDLPRDVAIGGDGKPVIGSVTLREVASFVRRLAGAVTNWPEVLARLLAASLGVRVRRDIRTRFRSGVEIIAPASRPAWWPAFEMFVEDVYHLCDLGDLDFGSGDIVLDLGAHIGTSAVLFGRRWPEATILCVEPNPSAFSYLRQNAEMNGTRAVLRNEAVGAADGVATLYGAGGASCEASTAVPVAGAKVEVAVVTFDRLVAEAPGTVRVVKLDCEGAERDVLATPAEVWQDVEVVLIEYHRTGDPSSEWPAIESRLNDIGLETRWHMAFDWSPGLGMAGFRRQRAGALRPG